LLIGGISVDWKFLIFGVVAVLAGALALVLLWKPTDEISKIDDPCLIAGVKLCSVPNYGKLWVEWRSNDPRIVQLYNEGRAMIFHACSRGGGDPETNYAFARKMVVQKVSDFLGTVVRSSSVLEKLNDREVYSRITEVFSPEKLVSGVIVVSKYKYVRLGIDHYCVVALYDPQLALMALRQYSSFVKELKRSGISWEEFQRDFEETVKRLHGGM